MSDERWPSSVKPLTNKNFSFNRGVNNLSTDVDGGLPRVRRDRTLDTPTFRLNFTLSQLDYQVIDYFYNKIIGSGSYSFFMNLDSGQGIAEHFGSIVRNTWSVTRPNNGNWYLAFDFRVESIPQQLEEECSNLYDIYVCYGKETGSIVKGITKLAKEWPSV